MSAETSSAKTSGWDTQFNHLMRDRVGMALGLPARWLADPDEVARLQSTNPEQYEVFAYDVRASLIQDGFVPPVYRPVEQPTAHDYDLAAGPQQS